MPDMVPAKRLVDMTDEEMEERFGGMALPEAFLGPTPPAEPRVEPSDWRSLPLSALSRKTLSMRRWDALTEAGIRDLGELQVMLLGACGIGGLNHWDLAALSRDVRRIRDTTEAKAEENKRATEPDDRSTQRSLFV